MAVNVLILTEGVADIIFLKDYLIHLNSNLQLATKKIKKELILESKNKESRIIIKAIGGYTRLENEQQNIQQFVDQEYKILVIQDTDDVSKDHGGYDERVKYLNDIKNKLSVEFETFLFPNNKDDGDLETLLLQIVNKSKYDPTHQCYTNFISSEESLQLGHTDELKESKSAIFNYFRAYNGQEKAKEINRAYELTHWEFDSSNIKSLHDFLKDVV